MLCDRGVNARVDKSPVVADAGGVGMVLANTERRTSLNADFHSVPTVHLDAAAGAAVKAYAATAGRRPRRCLGGQRRSRQRAPAMAAFSSAGPRLAGGGDLLKPDITAPGVDVIAAVSAGRQRRQQLRRPRSRHLDVGPHIAGIAALLKAKHPTGRRWDQVGADDHAAARPTTRASRSRSARSTRPRSNYGAGHVAPGSAFDPGLVYDSTPEDWMQYPCGIGHWRIGLVTESAATPSARSTRAT